MRAWDISLMFGVGGLEGKNEWDKRRPLAKTPRTRRTQRKDLNFYFNRLGINVAFILMIATVRLNNEKTVAKTTITRFC